MKTKNNNTADGTIRRTAIERLIAQYPDIPGGQLDDVLFYFKHEASALDRATIASNEAIYSRYRKLCVDHHLDRLKPFEIAIAATSAIVLIGGLAVLSLLY